MMKMNLNSLKTGPDAYGKFGIHGGRFVAETLMPLILDVENAYEKAWELFRETQHMQPDRDAIEAYLMKKLDLEKDAVHVVSDSSAHRNACTL